MYLDADYSLGGHPQAANDKARDLWLTGAKNLLPHLDSLVEKRMISMHKAMRRTYFLVHDPCVECVPLLVGN